MESVERLRLQRLGGDAGLQRAAEALGKEMLLVQRLRASNAHLIAHFMVRVLSRHHSLTRCLRSGLDLI